MHLIWKRCHSWGNVIDTARTADSGAGRSAPTDTYCPAPYDQFVIQWNGDVITCCTDYEGRTKTANVFAAVDRGHLDGRHPAPAQEGHAGGRLLDVCAKCQGVK